MRAVGQELLESCSDLRRFCARRGRDWEAYDAISALTSRIALLADTPEIAAAAFEVRFKAEELFHRPHVMPESILRLILEDRLQKLEAHVRTKLAAQRERRAPGQHGRRATDPASAQGAAGSRRTEPTRA